MEIMLKLARYINEGDWVNYVILGILAVAMAIVMERAWFYWIRCRVNSKKLLGEVTGLIRKERSPDARKLCSKTNTPLGYLMEAAIWKFEQGAGMELIREAVEEVSLREMPKFQRRTHFLNMYANISTLVGLLGTIMGLQTAFSALEVADPSQKGKLLAQGISVAMNTTAIGLGVALICMVAYSFLGNKSLQLMEQVDETMARLYNFLNGQQSLNNDKPKQN